MFNLFKKKEPTIKVIDRIWMYEKFKLNAFATELAKNPDTIFITWFDDSFQKIQSALSIDPTPVYNSREVSPAHIAGKKVILAEHYPLHEKENNLFTKLGLAEVTVWSALDEPIFYRFGAEKIIQMMKQLGMKEDVPIEHNMISKAIRNAQDKIAAKVTLEQDARSQNDWLERNIPKS